MSLFRTVRSKLYWNSAYLRYLWLKWGWYQRRKNAEKMSDYDFALSYYKQRTGKDLNLNDPQTFNEKLWYLKLHNRDPLLTICSDKYRVREYVEQCGLGHILNEVYGVYDNAKDIDFDTIPSPCFIKCNHTSGYNIIFDRGKPFNKKDFIRTFNFMLKQNYYYGGREWNYKNIEPKIVVEKVLRDKDGKLPNDYKFMCFHGEPKYLVFSKNSCSESGQHNCIGRIVNTYDMDFKLAKIDMDTSFPTIDDGSIGKPTNFEKMKEYAAILSKPFPHVRVDFYNIDGTIYFGEMTFYNGGGCDHMRPYEEECNVGKLIDLSEFMATTGRTENDRKSL